VRYVSPEIDQQQARTVLNPFPYAVEELDRPFGCEQVHNVREQDYVVILWYWVCEKIPRDHLHPRRDWLVR
jgi:hypothetical protein